MTSRRPSISVNDGEWVTISWSNQHEQCCGCGLRHRIDYRVVDGKLQFKGTNLGRPRKRRVRS